MLLYTCSSWFSQLCAWTKTRSENCPKVQLELEYLELDLLTCQMKARQVAEKQHDTADTTQTLFGSRTCCGEC